MADSATPLDYEAALRQLLPPGKFWEGQLQASRSDTSLYCRARAAEAWRFEQSRRQLWREAIPATSSQCLDDWVRTTGIRERVTDVAERRAQVLSVYTPWKERIKKLAKDHGLTLTAIENKAKPFHCGQSLGRRMWGMSAQTIHELHLVGSPNPEFERATSRLALVSCALIFYYQEIT